MAAMPSMYLYSAQRRSSSSRESLSSADWIIHAAAGSERCVTRNDLPATWSMTDYHNKANTISVSPLMNKRIASGLVVGKEPWKRRHFPLYWLCGWLLISRFYPIWPPFEKRHLHRPPVSTAIITRNQSASGTSGRSQRGCSSLKAADDNRVEFSFEPRRERARNWRHRLSTSNGTQEEKRKEGAIPCWNAVASESIRSRAHTRSSSSSTTSG